MKPRRNPRLAHSGAQILDQARHNGRGTDPHRLARGPIAATISIS
jgi:hypothetical protein